MFTAIIYANDREKYGEGERTKYESERSEEDDAAEDREENE
ncbi:MAG: hypothetical protein NUV90_03010 [Candidatus Parcubacteria bacterium]|nr:hypothetical protein [Candidatus Parcubacteria bacterium]